MILLRAVQVEGALDAANILKPALARGTLHCIGATTYEEYEKHMQVRLRPKHAYSVQHV